MAVKSSSKLLLEQPNVPIIVPIDWKRESILNAVARQYGMVNGRSERDLPAYVSTVPA